MKKKRRLKKQVYYFLIGLIIIIIAIISMVKYVKYINSNPYKLEKVGYKSEEIKLILTLDDNDIKKVIDSKYNQYLTKFMKQKYFIFKNLDRYIKYYESNKDTSYEKIVAIVNVKADYEWYDEKVVKKTDLSKGDLILVNKFHDLGKYVPDKIIPISNYYAYDNNEITEKVYEAYKKMWYAAKKEGLTLIVTSSYRDYDTQDFLWNRYANLEGDEWADSVSARAGFSEHQTGLTLDIVTYNTIMNDFEKTDEFKWLKKHAHEYGFILRYPKNKEDITGYAYESWHYRYVGEKVAKEIYDKDITFDEYYAYYIEK